MESGSDASVVITGASGLIGARLLDVLYPSFNIFALDAKRPENSADRPEIRWLECDLTDDASVHATLSAVRERCGNRIASVIHLAADQDFSAEPSPLDRELDVEATRRILRELEPAQVEQFIFLSSLFVMEPAEKGAVIRETSSTETRRNYAESKLEGERVARGERGEIPVVILRIAAVYDEECHCLPLAQQIARIYEKRMESYFFPGDASHGQAFVHVEDVARCILKTIAVRHELSREELFLIGETTVMNYAALQDCLGTLIHGEYWTTIRIPKVAAKAGAWVREKLGGKEGASPKPWMIDLADDHYPVAIDRARTKLDWSPRHDLESTLADMVRRLKANPKEWYKENNL